MNQATAPTRLPVELNWEMNETFDLLFGRGKTEMEKAVEALRKICQESLDKKDFDAAGVALARRQYILREVLKLPAEQWATGLKGYVGGTCSYQKLDINIWRS